MFELEHWGFVVQGVCEGSSIPDVVQLSPSPDHCSVLFLLLKDSSQSTVLQGYVAVGEDFMENLSKQGGLLEEEKGDLGERWAKRAEECGCRQLKAGRSQPGALRISTGCFL